MPTLIPTRLTADAEAISRLRAALGKTSRHLRGTAAGRDLTPTQLSILGTVSRAGALPLSELARSEAVNPTMLSRIVGKLEALGLVTRTPDPDDRRAANVAITTAGRTLGRRIRRERDGALVAHLDNLPPEHADALLAALPALEALAASLQED